jgi:hypothetical protein
MAWRGIALLSLAVPLACGCSSEEDAKSGSGTLAFVAATFNTGTGSDGAHDAPPDDGYGEAEAALSDQYYGNGLAWMPVIEDTTLFLGENPVDVIGFQEIFPSELCAGIPPEAKTGFVCESWQPGDPTVAQLIVGEGFQVACHEGHADKCIGVRESFGKIRGCDAALCLDALDGGTVTGCGSGSRIGRAVIELSRGGTLTVVNVHGTSGINQEDQDCRVQQFHQIFVDLGDGQPAANGERNLILGDFNTDPGRMADFDESAAVVVEHAGDGKAFHFVTEVGADATPTYAIFNIDHVISDTLQGSCWHAGIDEGHPDVTSVVYFDHKPAICNLSE